MSRFDDLPAVALATLSGGPETLLLTPNARLAGELRQRHGQWQRLQGRERWLALDGATPAQWLDRLCSAALLRSEIAPEAMPGLFLSRAQERCLWARVVGGKLAAQAGDAAVLFDLDGLARSAQEADALIDAWQIGISEAWHNAESRSLQQWRTALAAELKRGDWLGTRQAQRWRIGCIRRGIGGLPVRVVFAGFIDEDPLLDELLSALAARGVELARLAPEQQAAARVQVCADADDECRAAAEWAAEQLAAQPQARLRIGVADWPRRRAALEAALERALHPEAVGGDWAGVERRWQAVDGLPLERETLVVTAMQLLQLALAPQAVEFAAFSALLRAPGWSADVGEADARARWECALREQVGPQTTLERLRRLASAELGEASPVRLVAHLQLLAEFRRSQPTRQLPGAWGAAFAVLLQALGWPGERPPTPLEQATCRAWADALSGLAALDAIVGRVDGAEALRLLRQTLREMVVRAPRRAPAAVEIGALDAVAGLPCDGLWLMGLNEGQWPPPAQPNPLLPATLQRRAGVPTACALRQSERAQRQLRLWQAQASVLVCSCAAREGERALRASPLLAGLPVEALASAPAPDIVPAALEHRHDARAPAPDAAELARLSGGTAMLAAQAACPAWAFYQFRLGAAVLPAPTSGLDARLRGSLLHAALEALWRGRAQAELAALADDARAAAIAAAIDSALARVPRWSSVPVSARLLALERERLLALLDEWLRLELTRPAFVVEACEARHELQLAGLPLRVVVDRVDRLDDGRLVILDYKSGRSASADGWADERLTEPQLPIYAALLFPGQPLAAVALARVVRDGAAFSGVAESDEILPDVKPLAAQRKRYDEFDFADWPALRVRWAERLEALAGEIVAGVAAVVVADEGSLAYCPVLPLLRLAERRAQWQAAGEEAQP